MPGDVASTKKGAEHAKSPRNDDRGFSVAARARGLDSSAPAQRGWGLRAAGPIIHPSTAGARTRTRQVGITGHRNGSTGWRKIQQGVAQNSTRGGAKFNKGYFAHPLDVADFLLQNGRTPLFGQWPVGNVGGLC